MLLINFSYTLSQNRGYSTPGTAAVPGGFPVSRLALNSHLRTWTWGMFPPLCNWSEWLSKLKLPVQTIWSLLNNHFPSENPKSWCLLHCSCPQTQLLVKIQWMESLINFPGRQHLVDRATSINTILHLSVTLKQHCHIHKRCSLY